MAEDIDAELRAFEKVALGLGRVVNEAPLSKALQYRFLRNFSYGWMRPAMARRTYVHNASWLIAPPSDRGVLFACNHSSFFDAYLYLFSLYCLGAKWPRKLYFPVRSDFFYDSPMGLLVNFAIGAGVMYPPIYRESGHRELNADALDRICGYLNSPNSVVGLHPEGKRNKGDPYDHLPAQPGIGQVVLKAKPLVVPVFVHGLSNDFLDSIRTSFRAEAKREQPIIVAFGEPVDYEEFTGKKPRATLYKRCADRIMESVAECGRTERDLRARIVSGDIALDAPGWLS